MGRRKAWEGGTAPRCTAGPGQGSRLQPSRCRPVLRAALLLAVLPNLAFAQHSGSPESAQGPAGSPFFAFGVGRFHLHSDQWAAVDVRLEYRHGRGLWRLRPWLGVEVTSDGAFYGLGGLAFVQPLGRILVVQASVGGGLYSAGDGRPLNHAFELRSQLETAFRLSERSRIGAAVSHISNGGLSEDNPGVEVLTLYYGITLWAPSGRGSPEDGDRTQLR